MAIGDLYNADNVVVGQAAVFTAPAGTALPDLASFNLDDPFDETFWTTGDPALWVPVGATEQGWQLGADKSTNSIAIEEQSTPVGTTISSQSITIQGSLSEDITKTLALAMNATVETVAPSATIGGHDVITPSDDPLYYAVGMVTTNAEGFGRIVYAPKWTSLGNISTAFRRAAGQRLYAVNFSTVCKPSEIETINFTAAKTA